MARRGESVRVYPFRLRSERDYTPKDPGDLIWVFLRSLTPTPDGDGLAEYLPMYEGAEWQTISARTFRARYRKLRR